MTIYLLTIFLLFILAFVEAYYHLSEKTKRILYNVAYIVLVTQVGLRWETGTDWEQYLLHFKSFRWAEATSSLINMYEYGYNLFVWIVRLFTSNYSVFLLLHATVYYFLIFRSFKNYTPYLFTSLLMYYVLSMGMMGANRQLIALAICVYSLRYSVENKPVKFFLLIFLASNFHITAILFGIYYFIGREIKPATIILILCCAFIIGMFKLPVLAFSYFGNLIGGNTATKTVLYLNAAKIHLSDSGLSLFGLLKRLILLTIFYYNRKRISEELSYYTLMLNGYIIGITFYFLFVNSLLSVVSRGSVFFNIMEPLLIASQLCLFKRKGNIIIILVFLLAFSIVFFFQSIRAYPDLFIPYKSLFINTEFVRFKA